MICLTCRNFSSEYWSVSPRPTTLSVQARSSARNSRTSVLGVWSGTSRMYRPSLYSMSTSDELMVSIRSRMSFSCLLSWAEKPAMSRMVFWLR